MKKLVILVFYTLLLAFVALPRAGFAQTVYQLGTTVCRSYANCELPAAAPGEAVTVWVDNPNFVDVLSNTGAFVFQCTDVVSFSFAYTQSPPPGPSNPADVPFTYAVQCDTSTNTIAVNAFGFGYYSSGGGGRGGGGAGVRYEFQGGTATIR